MVSEASDPTGGEDSGSPVTRQAAHAAILQIYQHADGISWNRLYNFLMFSTILVLAWSTIYSQGNRPRYASFAMALISSLGFIGGIAWAAVGHRGRRFTTFILEQGKRLEDLSKEDFAICTMILESHHEFSFKYVGSYRMMVLTPLVFCWLYGVLFVLSLV
jgi:hypothetical protein